MREALKKALAHFLDSREGRNFYINTAIREVREALSSPAPEVVPRDNHVEELQEARACGSCNASKRDMPLRKWLKKQKNTRQPA